MQTNVPCPNRHQKVGKKVSCEESRGSSALPIRHSNRGMRLDVQKSCKRELWASRKGGGGGGGGGGGVRHIDLSQQSQRAKYIMGPPGQREEKILIPYRKRIEPGRGEILRVVLTRRRKESRDFRKISQTGGDGKRQR